MLSYTTPLIPVVKGNWFSPLAKGESEGNVAYISQKMLSKAS
jgi:hypothetical protein